jgi:hypothetical protein
MSWFPLALLYGMLFSPTGELYVPATPRVVRDRMCLLREGMSPKRVESILELRKDQILVIGQSSFSRHCEYQIGPECRLWLVYDSSDLPDESYWALASAELKTNGPVLENLPNQVLVTLGLGGSIRRHFRPPFERALTLAQADCNENRYFPSPFQWAVPIAK